MHVSGGDMDRSQQSHTPARTCAQALACFSKLLTGSHGSLAHQPDHVHKHMHACRSVPSGPTNQGSTSPLMCSNICSCSLRHARALLAASQSVLLSTYGGLLDVETRVNNTVTGWAGCDAILLFAHLHAQHCLLTATGTSHSLEVCCPTENSRCI
jgi:hypothetical protein